MTFTWKDYATRIGWHLSAAGAQPEGLRRPASPKERLANSSGCGRSMVRVQVESAYQQAGNLSRAVGPGRADVRYLFSSHPAHRRL
jgi:hypothetical protein